MRFAFISIAAATLLTTAMTACEPNQKKTEATPPPPAPPPAPASSPAPPSSPAPVTPAAPPATSGPVFTTTQTTGPLAVEETARAIVTAKVKAIDYATRRVTLEGPSGRTIQFVAGKEIQRLNEVRVGDTVNVEYVVSLLAELRPPTPDEAANPIAIVDIADAPRKGRRPPPARSARRGSSRQSNPSTSRTCVSS